MENQKTIEEQAVELLVRAARTANLSYADHMACNNAANILLKKLQELNGPSADSSAEPANV